MIEAGHTRDDIKSKLIMHCCSAHNIEYLDALHNLQVTYR